jgi:hypothetical protein
MPEDQADRFRNLGVRRVVYLKAGMRDGEQAIVIYGADGVALDVVDGLDTALEKLARTGLSLVALH